MSSSCLCRRDSWRNVAWSLATLGSDRPARTSSYSFSSAATRSYMVMGFEATRGNAAATPARRSPPCPDLAPSLGWQVIGSAEGGAAPAPGIGLRNGGGRISGLQECVRVLFMADHSVLNPGMAFVFGSGPRHLEPQHLGPHDPFFDHDFGDRGFELGSERAQVGVRCHRRLDRVGPDRLQYRAGDSPDVSIATEGGDLACVRSPPRVPTC